LGLRSTAIEMENNPKLYLSGLCAASIGCFALGGINAGLGSFYFGGLSFLAAHYAW
jgi:4-hydroxybenzoate polyprenyltransferase